MDAPDDRTLPELPDGWRLKHLEETWLWPEEREHDQREEWTCTIAHEGWYIDGAGLTPKECIEDAISKVR